MNRFKENVIGFLVFLFALVSFSGFFGNFSGALRILDFQTFVGSFGIIAAGASAGIVGTGGTGVKEGFFQAINMAPNMIFSVAFLAVVERYYGLQMAQRLLTPLLRPLLGVPGIAATVMITDLQSSDASAAITRSLLDQKQLTHSERDIIVGYGFVSAAIVGVFFSVGALMFPYLTVPTGALLLLLIAMKILSANLMRLYLRITEGPLAHGEPA